MMYAVGVDVSNGRSTIAVLDDRRNVGRRPFEVSHTADGLVRLVELLNELDGEIRIVLEHTGRYYESIAMFLHGAGFFVCALNPLIIRHNGANSIRKVKTDKADAKKLASYALDYWSTLQQYTPADTIRYELKTLHRQFQLASKNRTACSNNLVALLEQTFPHARSLFESPVRSDGTQKWVDFVYTFWHADCVSKLSCNAFTEKYQKWCTRHGYNFSKRKAAEIHQIARQVLPLVPKSEIAKLMVKEAVNQLNTISHTVEIFRAEMNRLASKLPEYETVMAMTGVGPSMGPQLMAEIGDPRRFRHPKSLVAYAGIDPEKDDSGDKNRKSMPTTKRGSPYLRRTLFIIMSVLLQLHPVDEPVYQFLDKKRSEGKPYYVYMTAGNTKFLRIYYGKVRDALKAKGLWESLPTEFLSSEPVNPV